jgi:hypothetical protein
MKVIEETPYRFRIEQEGAMRVPGIVFTSKALLPDEHADTALQQVVQPGWWSSGRSRCVIASAIRQMTSMATCSVSGCAAWVRTWTTRPRGWI